MSTADERMNAAPVLLRFVDGTEYRMSPLTDRDISEMDEWVRLTYINLAMKSLPHGTSEERRDAVRFRAVGESMALTWTSSTGAALMATVDGMTRLVWQGVRVNHPDVTLEDLRKHLFSRENLSMVRSQFRRANVPEADEGQGPDPRRPARRRARGNRAARSRNRRSTGR